MLYLEEYPVTDAPPTGKKRCRLKWWLWCGALLLLLLPVIASLPHACDTESTWRLGAWIVLAICVPCVVGAIVQMVKAIRRLPSLQGRNFAIGCSGFLFGVILMLLGLCLPFAYYGRGTSRPVIAAAIGLFFIGFGLFFLGIASLLTAHYLGRMDKQPHGPMARPLRPAEDEAEGQGT